ncbi:hypothetical protein CJ030_MR2G002428 [Morella rubra]|uniref:Pentatricopeptide repeat-containing protein n=1 Tax=Morella rubra TaxID=262757 RepID=A0A6A1WHD1_9ROSI|nr:hypothetical protein CJ030_MR2G002428 [Morella rubra]
MASLAVTTTPNSQFSPFKPFKANNSQKIVPAQLPKLQDDAMGNQFSYQSYFHRISSHCKEGQLQRAVNLLAEMELNNLPVGPEVYIELLQGCVDERALFVGQQLHSRIVKNGDFFARNENIETKLVIFYSNCGVLEVGSRLFRSLRVQNVFSWAAIIGLHCRIGDCEEALLGLLEMHESGVLLDNFLAPNALKACSALRWIGFGKGVHAYVVKLGLDRCVFVASSLVDMYGKCGVMEDARKVFASILERNVFAWNSLIMGYVQNGMNEEAIEVFYDMRAEGVEPSRVTVSSFLSASANIGGLQEGKQGHAIAILGGLELDNILGSSIINFYFQLEGVPPDVKSWNSVILGFLRNGQVNEAKDVFLQMRSSSLQPNLITWTTLISGLAHNDSSDEALLVFKQMQETGIKPNNATLVSALSACVIWQNYITEELFMAMSQGITFCCLYPLQHL